MASSTCSPEAAIPSSGWNRNPRRPHPAMGARRLATIRHPSNRSRERRGHIERHLLRRAGHSGNGLRRSWKMRSSSTRSSLPTRTASWSSCGTLLQHRLLEPANRPGPPVPPRLWVRGRGSRRQVPGRPHLESPTAPISLRHKPCPYHVRSALYLGSDFVSCSFCFLYSATATSFFVVQPLCPISELRYRVAVFCSVSLFFSPLPPFSRVHPHIHELFRIAVQRLALAFGQSACVHHRDWMDEIRYNSDYRRQRQSWPTCVNGLPHRATSRNLLRPCALAVLHAHTLVEHAVQLVSPSVHLAL